MKSSVALLLLAASILGCAMPIQTELDAEVDRLCAIDGGVVVFETVRLHVARFDESGNFRIPAIADATAADEYFYQGSSQRILQRGSSTVTRSVHQVIRRRDQKVLGVSIDYARAGGDPPGPWQPSSYICPPISKEFPSVEARIFIEATKP